MKVLYAIQGTGNGHLSRAREVLPILSKKCDLKILVSGCDTDIDLDQAIDYQYHGLGFIFGKKGGIDVWKTVKNTRLKRLRREIQSVPVKDFDLIINDFEPVSAWAAFEKGIPCVSMSHQTAVLTPKAPKPINKDMAGYLILKNYAPAQRSYGFHFQRYDENTFTPVIRKEIRDLKTEDQGFYLVYLPSYSEERIYEFLTNFPETNWVVYSKKTSESHQEKNILFHKAGTSHFTESFRTCKGVLCGAGFETPAEALYLKKKLLVVPMKGQFEQQCNAAALQEMGIPAIKNIKSNKKNIVSQWLNESQTLSLEYPDETEAIIDRILRENGKGS